MLELWCSGLCHPPQGFIRAAKAETRNRDVHSMVMTTRSPFIGGNEMTAQHKREQVYPRTDHKDAMLDEHEAINNRLRARIVELAAMVDMMKDVNAAQAAEIVTLTAEVERMTAALKW